MMEDLDEEAYQVLLETYRKRTGLSVKETTAQYVPERWLKSRAAAAKRRSAK
jgi:hypothetical protein